jgi:signal transduction histidine kinase
VSTVEGSNGGIAQRIERMRVGQSLAITIGVLLVFAVVGIGLALLANARLSNRRELLLEEIGPSLRSAIRLEDALVNEETGVRGYLITAQSSFLEPYRQGLEEETRAYRDLRAREHATGPEVAAQVDAVRASAEAWREHYVQPTLRATGRTRRGSIEASIRGKTLFDAIRTPLQRLQADLTIRDDQTRSQLNDASNVLQLALLVAAALIIGSVLAAGLFLRKLITRPLAQLGAEARRVTDGDFATPLAAGGGPREVADVAADMEAMRERIVHELASVQEGQARLASQAEELARSNAELEQFAYVASHDLQEPLRKIASFCQALQLRYGGQLDERADQYIEFAVDGAKRMQVLINALLALSRVGRVHDRRERVELQEVLAAAESALAVELREAGARVLAEPLPAVLGDETLLVSLFQNLIGNAIKFRGAAPPVVRVACERRGEGWWCLSFADNGIGIEPEYAERIFQIFQRLHNREAYEGTGIGLALCRKIVEYHGGRIWLDQQHSGGARFELTLPIAKETD